MVPIGGWENDSCSTSNFNNFYEDTLDVTHLDAVENVGGGNKVSLLMVHSNFYTHQNQHKEHVYVVLELRASIVQNFHFSYIFFFGYRRFSNPLGWINSSGPEGKRVKSPVGPVLSLLKASHWVLLGKNYMYGKSEIKYEMN